LRRLLARKGARVPAPGSLGVTQDRAGRYHAAQTQQTLQQRTPGTAATICTSQSIEATVIHMGLLRARGEVEIKTRASLS
jgi:hypothetical protein